MNISVKFCKLHPLAKPFKYSREGDACMDVYSLARADDAVVPAGQSVIIPTGIALEIPEGYEGQIRGRSGFSSRGILVQLGTIESGYRGEIGVMLHNASGSSFHIKAGESIRIAQFTVKPVVMIELEESEELSSTERGSSGYGSSGQH